MGSCVSSSAVAPRAAARRSEARGRSPVPEESPLRPPSLVQASMWAYRAEAAQHGAPAVVAPPFEVHHRIGHGTSNSFVQAAIRLHCIAEASPVTLVPISAGSYGCNAGPHSEAAWFAPVAIQIATAEDPAEEQYLDPLGRRLDCSDAGYGNEGFVTFRPSFYVKLQSTSDTLFDYLLAADHQRKANRFAELARAAPKPPPLQATPERPMSPASSPSMSSPPVKRRSHQHLRAQLAAEEASSPRSSQRGEEGWSADAAPASQSVVTDALTLRQFGESFARTVSEPAATNASPWNSRADAEEPRTPTSEPLPHHTDKQGLTQYILDRLNAPMQGTSPTAGAARREPPASPRSARSQGSAAATAMGTPARPPQSDASPSRRAPSAVASPAVSEITPERPESARHAVQFSLDLGVSRSGSLGQGLAAPPRPPSPRSRLHQHLREHARRHEQQLIAELAPVRSHWAAYGSFFAAVPDRDPSRNKLVCGLCWKLMHVEQHTSVLPCGHVYHTNCICPQLPGARHASMWHAPLGGAFGAPMLPSPSVREHRGAARAGHSYASVTVDPSVRSASPSQVGTTDLQPAASIADPGDFGGGEEAPSEFHSTAAEAVVSEVGSVACARSSRSYAALSMDGKHTVVSQQDTDSDGTAQPAGPRKDKEREREREKASVAPSDAPDFATQADEEADTESVATGGHSPRCVAPRTKAVDPAPKPEEAQATPAEGPAAEPEPEPEPEPAAAPSLSDEPLAALPTDVPPAARTPSSDSRSAHGRALSLATEAVAGPSDGPAPAAPAAAAPGGVTTHVVSGDNAAERLPQTEAPTVPPQATDVPPCPLCWRPRRNG